MTNQWFAKLLNTSSDARRASEGREPLIRSNRSSDRVSVRTSTDNTSLRDHSSETHSENLPTVEQVSPAKSLLTGVGMESQTLKAEAMQEAEKVRKWLRGTNWQPMYMARLERSFSKRYNEIYRTSDSDKLILDKVFSHNKDSYEKDLSSIHQIMFDTYHKYKSVKAMHMLEVAHDVLECIEEKLNQARELDRKGLLEEADDFKIKERLTRAKFEELRTSLTIEKHRVENYRAFMVLDRDVRLSYREIQKIWESASHECRMGQVIRCIRKDYGAYDASAKSIGESQVVTTEDLETFKKKSELLLVAERFFKKWGLPPKPPYDLTSYGISLEETPAEQENTGAN